MESKAYSQSGTGHTRTTGNRVELKFSSACNYSTWKIVKCSVLEGSVLGLRLFNIYIMITKFSC